MPSVVMKDGTRRKVVITPLVEPDARRDDERGGHADPDREVVLVSERRATHTIAGASAKTRPTREVDLAADEEHHLAGRDQRDRRHRLGDVLDVVALEEDAAFFAREEERQRDRDDEDARLAAAQERAGDAPAEAGASLWRGQSSASRPAKALRDGVLLRGRAPSYRVFVVRYGLTFVLGHEEQARVRVRRGDAGRRTACRGTAA